MAEGDEESVRAKYRLRDVQDWRVAWAQRDLRRSGPSEDNLAPILYRPFDTRYTYYTGTSRGFLCRPRADVMGHMLAEGNSGMCVGRAGQVIGAAEWDVVFACASPTDFNLFRRGGNCLFPLYLYPGVGRSGELLLSPWPKGKDCRRPNLDPGFVERLAEATGRRFVPDGRGDLRATFDPEDVLAYIYAVFHSPGYRERYEAHLKLDFPRVPPCASGGLFRALAKTGHELLALHTLKSPSVGRPITTYTGPRNLEVSRVGGLLTANITAGDHVSLTRTARSATPAVLGLSIRRVGIAGLSARISGNSNSSKAAVPTPWDWAHAGHAASARTAHSPWRH